MFSPNSQGGGAERVFSYLARGLSERGYPVDLVLASAKGPYLADLPPAVRVIDLRVGRILSAIYPLVRYLRSERPAVLLSALDYANVAAIFAARLARTSTRVIPTVHVAHSRVFNPPSKSRDRLLWLAIRASYPCANAIVAVSRGIAEDLRDLAGIQERLIHVIYNPVLTPEREARAKEVPAHRWFASPGPDIILSIGSFVPAKDQATLIRAFAILRKKKPARLLILGEGALRKELENLVLSLGLAGEVSLPGFVGNPFACLSRASLFVLSSAWEALPTVLIEALAAGVPIVATDCRHGPAEILDHGRHGRLTPVGDAAALAEAMQDGLAQPRRDVPGSILQPYTLKAAVDAYINLIDGENHA